MNQVEGLSLACPLASQYHRIVLMLSVAAVEIVKTAAGLAGSEECAGNARTGRCRHGSFGAASCHLPFQRPQDLLSASRAVFRDSQERIGDVENTHAQHRRSALSLSARRTLVKAVAKSEPVIV